MKKLSLYLMCGFYILAGWNHFWHPSFYEALMPWYLPFPKFLIFISGVCEIVLGILLIPMATRRVAAYLIIAMLIVFFIIHVQMLIDFLNTNNKFLWGAILRIPLQFILIWWAYSFSKKINIKS